MQQGDARTSAVRRWQLAEALRQLREDVGLTSDQVIAELQRGREARWSRPKLSRIENQEQGVRPREVEQLLDVYGVTDADMRARLVGLASAPRQRGWVSDVRRNLPEEFHRFLDWETAIVARRQFETLLVPGLLQTPDYARALVAGVNPGLTEDEIDRRVSARITRQQILSRAEPPHLHVILDAGVLERPVRSAQVMRHQLRRLLDAAESDHITIQVLPKSVGASPALEGPFSVLTPPEPIPDLGYAEGPGRAAYIEDRDDVRAFVLRFGTLTEQALGQAESARAISDAAEGYQ